MFDWTFLEVFLNSHLMFEQSVTHTGVDKGGPRPPNCWAEFFFVKIEGLSLLEPVVLNLSFWVRSNAMFTSERPVAAIQVVQVVRCTRAHDPWGPTSEDQIATFLKNYFLLFLTLPVTVATAERSFSKLKLIKTYLRNIMQDDRLSGLAVLTIENAEARKLDVSKIIDDFASRKARRRKFWIWCK